MKSTVELIADDLSEDITLSPSIDLSEHKNLVLQSLKCRCPYIVKDAISASTELLEAVIDGLTCTDSVREQSVDCIYQVFATGKHALLPLVQFELESRYHQEQAEELNTSISAGAMH